MADIRIKETPEDFFLYDTWVKAHPHGSLWQSLEWKRYQEALGREIRIYIAEAPHPSPLPRGEGTFLASAMVVIDRTTGGWSTWDIPRGPLFVPRSSFLVDAFLKRIVSDAMQQRCLGVYLSPPKNLPTTHEQRSTRNEQPSATRIIDLTPSEDDILAQMHPKGRYNIKVAQKNGVLVEQSDDVEAFYGLLQQTAGRDGFRILPLKAYKKFLECLPGGFLLLAFSPPSPFAKGEGQGERVPIAGLMGIIWPNPPLPRPLSHCGRRGGAVPPPLTGIYYYGASAYTHRGLMAPYALQWEAMRLCKGKGCAMYDLLGVAPHIHPPSPSPCPLPRGEGIRPLTLPSPAGRGNTAPHPALSPTLAKATAGRRGERETAHQWAGVSAFKEKFGGTVVTYPPEQQIVLRPLLWRVLQWKRWVIG